MKELLKWDSPWVQKLALITNLVMLNILESNTKIRFRLKNGLELPETIERTVR